MRVAGVLLLIGLVLSGAAAAVAFGAQGATVTAGSIAAADLSLPDPELAPVVGLAQAPAVLGIATGPAPARVLAVPRDAPADLGALEPTGRTFAFTDPHGNAWSVQEYHAAWGYAYGTATGPVTEDGDAGTYNFVLLVDHTNVGTALRIVAA